jgi:hypothetical protein
LDGGRTGWRGGGCIFFGWRSGGLFDGLRLGFDRLRVGVGGITGPSDGADFARQRGAGGLGGVEELRALVQLDDSEEHGMGDAGDEGSDVLRPAKERDVLEIGDAGALEPSVHALSHLFSVDGVVGVTAALDGFGFGHGV